MAAVAVGSSRSESVIGAAPHPPVEEPPPERSFLLIEWERSGSGNGLSADRSPLAYEIVLFKLQV